MTTTAHNPVRFSAESAGHKALFAARLLEAADSETPVYIGRISLPKHRVACLRAEGQARTEANRRRLGCRFKERQFWDNCPLSLDEIGRLAEGAVEELLEVQAAPVVEGVDARPDVVFHALRMDVKATFDRNSFAIAKSVAGGYDALIFVSISADKKLHVWAVKSRPDAWELRPGVRGGDDFYLVKCPAPALLH